MLSGRCLVDDRDREGQSGRCYWVVDSDRVQVTEKQHGNDDQCKNEEQESAAEYHFLKPINLGAELLLLVTFVAALSDIHV